MKSSGHFPTEPPASLPAPYPSGEPGDWRIFGVGVFLIALFLSALAFSPTGAKVSPSATGGQGLATRTTTSTRALVRQERDTQTVGGESVLAQTGTAEDL